ncbi:MAG: hypothetical protein U0270_26725 [Labilithrix sp.]
MSMANLVPAGVNPSKEHQDVLLELAYLTTAADGKLHDEEIDAFAQIVSRLRGKTATDAEVGALMSKFGKLHQSEIADRVQAIAPTLPRELQAVAFKLAVGLGVADLDATEEESELQAVLAEALGFDDETVGELTDQVYAALNAGDEE